MSRFHPLATAALLFLGSFATLASVSAMEMPMGGDDDGHEHNIFHPLSCNANLATLSSPTDCTALSSLLNSTDLSSDAELVVPCGTCVVADYDALLATSSIIDLRGGINIEGLLHFPAPSSAGQSIQIQTPHVIVQGELRIDAPGTVIPTNGPDGEVPLEFVMVGSTDVLFTPHADNAMACMERGGR